MNATRPPTPAGLDPDDVALLRALATDDPLDVIARRLSVSERTLRRRARALYDHLGVTGRVAAALWAERRALLNGTERWPVPAKDRRPC